MKKTNAILLLSLWTILTICAWFGPAKEISDAERRPLKQFPQLSASTLLSGNFMTEFEDYTLDQFPLRDGFRTVKSLFHSYVMGQKDNNGIYIADGYAVKQEYPMNQGSVDHALERFQYLYDKYLTESRVFMTIVPDKGYYLAESGGHLAMDYEAMFDAFRQGMPWAEFVDITQCLTASDYYRTDTHWQQHQLFPAAEKLCNALGITAPAPENYRAAELERPFYGVYYGQAALPMEADTIRILNSPLLENCTVYDHETGKTTSVYDMDKLDSKDLYEVFLSGPKSLLTIENPAGQEGKELIVFRDSFGSAMIPLLVQDYAKVTVVDIRYIQIDLLDRFIDFRDQDVLFLYSTLVLNNSATIK